MAGEIITIESARQLKRRKMDVTDRLAPWVWHPDTDGPVEPQ
jgi:hypothetical protein